jgi:hypothetical protein
MKKLSTAALATTLVAVGLPTCAIAHRSGCHGAHSCPSDHATYRWRGKLCVKPTAEEPTTSFDKKLRYGGLTYYCR